MNTRTKIATKSSISWHLTPCSLLKVNRYFEEHVASKISTVFQWIALRYINILQPLLLEPQTLQELWHLKLQQQSDNDFTVAVCYICNIVIVNKQKICSIL
jgi:hypothetical protein